MSTTELNDLTIGQVQDLMVEYVKAEDQKHNKENGKARKATQADFDAF